MNLICAECGGQGPFRSRIEDAPITLDGETFYAKDEVFTCPACGVDFSDARSEIDPFADAYAQYRARHGREYRPLKG